MNNSFDRFIYDDVLGTCRAHSGLAVVVAAQSTPVWSVDVLGVLDYTCWYATDDAKGGTAS